MTIEVTLHGANGSRQTTVNKRGLSTRHIVAPRETVPSIFEPVSTPSATETNENPEQTPKFNATAAVVTTAKTEPLEQPVTPEPFTETQLLDIIEKMTALDVKDGAKTQGWQCEDMIFKVAAINLKHNVAAPVLREMLFGLTKRGVLEHKRQWGLNKFRLTPTQPLVELLAEVDAVMGVIS